MSRPAITHQLVFLLARQKLGRRSLAQRSGLSEMAVRLELERLRDEGLVAPVKSGVTLTDSGERRFRSLLAHVRTLKAHLLQLGNWSFLFKGITWQERVSWHHDRPLLSPGAG